jgi:hypothetical protein
LRIICKSYKFTAFTIKNYIDSFSIFEKYLHNIWFLVWLDVFWSFESRCLAFEGQVEIGWIRSSLWIKCYLWRTEVDIIGDILRLCNSKITFLKINDKIDTWLLFITAVLFNCRYLTSLKYNLITISLFFEVVTHLKQKFVTMVEFQISYPSLNFYDCIRLFNASYWIYGFSYFKTSPNSLNSDSG